MGSSEYIRLRILVRGRVQGVGFRRFVYKRALNFPVSGWVRNNADGSVEIEVAGESQIVSSFCGEVSKGSFIARVDEMEEIHREACKEKPSGQFVIRG